jgi:hypothetical protein
VSTRERSGRQARIRELHEYPVGLTELAVQALTPPQHPVYPCEQAVPFGVQHRLLRQLNPLQHEEPVQVLPTAPQDCVWATVGAVMDTSAGRATPLAIATFRSTVRRD